MELKGYQTRVITDLIDFLEYLSEYKNLRQSFRSFWDDRGAAKMEDYKNNVPGTPHVCIKVPTAGGKTFLAANALKPIFDVVAPESSGVPRVVIWLVPSLVILEQTVRNFGDPAHPYRQRLNTHFKGRVELYDKNTLLQGAGFSPDSIKGQLTIILLSFDSLRARNKDDRKIFQENGSLASFAVPEDELLAGSDSSALINVMRSLKPVLVVDESHNAESDLSVEMLQNLNPSFILDLTATPRKNSNIISFVDALALKRENMVKLPVIVYNRPDKTEVVSNALLLRRKLETLAIAEEKKTGKYIRPIILFQAEPKTADDKETFEKVRATLIRLKIPAEQIAIKTANINELKNVDLMSSNCKVRYIITVNALKEGWDCPFAYILASLADKSSAVDVEQIVGRILRQPYVVEHKEPLLNMSYVFTASGRFIETLDKIVKGLNRAGFSERDYRAITELSSEALSGKSVHPDLFAPLQDVAPSAVIVSNGQGDEEVEEDRILGGSDGTDFTVEPDEKAGISQNLEQITAIAKVANEEFIQKAQNSDNSLSPDLESRMNKFYIKDVFLQDAKNVCIPQFFTKVPPGGFFETEESLVLLDKDNLLADFKLRTCDVDLSFDAIDSEAYTVDLEVIGAEDYSPKFKKIDSRRKALLNAHILSLPQDKQVKNLASHLAGMMGNMFPIPDKDIAAYILRILREFSAEQIHDCIERDYSYVAKIKRKIKDLAMIYSEKTFNNWLTTEQIVTAPSYRFPEFITPSLTGSAISNSLYTQERKANRFEESVINEVANLPSIQFWHKNADKSNFVMNGFINHYPDYIIRTTSGKIILLETKGDDRDNSDSVAKLKLGNLWEKQAGSMFRYLMVFDNNPIAGAYKLDDALGLLRQL